MSMPDIAGGNEGRRYRHVSKLVTVLFSAGVAISSQRLSQSDLFVGGADGYQTFRIPAIVVSTKGSVLAFCEGRKNGPADTGAIDVVLRRSMDSGETWGATKVIWSDGPNTCDNPTAIVDRQTDTIWLFVNHNVAEDDEQTIARGRSKAARTVWVSKSDDDGITWSKPTEITKMVTKSEWGWYATGPGVGIQLEHGPHAGRLLIPCTHTIHHDRSQRDLFEYEDHVIYSDDKVAWHIGGVVKHRNVDEAQLVELDGGSIMMNMRSDPRKKKENRRVVAISENGGRTWRNVRHEEVLIEPPCQASLVRYTKRPEYQTNRLLFSNPASTESRMNMTVRLSYDEGKTWPLAKVIYAGPSAYSCLTVLPDMSISLLYERGNKYPYESVTFARFTLERLTDAADHLEGSATK